jgi:hydrogenase large subunit
VNKTLTLDMNRVEGDLQVKVSVADGVVQDAWMLGTMFRGFEQIMLGRAPMDALVITPRICGICGTGHLYAAVSALETALQIPSAPNGTRVRNICLMAEEIQSDARHAFLMFTIDLCHKRYANMDGYSQIVEAFEAFRGRIYRATVVQTKKLLEIVALFGGQWPHSSYMIPGGVATLGNRRAIVKSLSIVDAYTQWYEREVLGCSLDRWLAIQSEDDLFAWLDEKSEHRNSAFGLFLGFAKRIGLEKLGRGNGNLLSYGVYFDPDGFQPPYRDRVCLRPGGFYDAETQTIQPFSQEHVAEHVKYSHFEGEDKGTHPSCGKTIPLFQKGGNKYSWAKAPRYRDQVVETGCLAELYMAGDPLAQSLFQKGGATVFTRQICRFHRPALSLVAIRNMLIALEKHFLDSFYEPQKEGLDGDGDGVGLVHAARGALGHWVGFRAGRITRYQVISPTSWNASPRDSYGRRGHWEQSLIGTPIQDESDPIELGHVIRSHDACLVCAVHFLESGRKYSYVV